MFIHLSASLSICPHIWSVDSIGQISVIFDIGDYYESLLRKYKFG